MPIMGRWRVLAALCAMLGCASTRAGAPGATPTARGGGPPPTAYPTVPMRDAAVAIAERRCQREQRCGIEAGPWPPESACRADRTTKQLDQLTHECPEGIDGAPLEACVETLSAAPCGETGALSVCELAFLCAP